jgi:hypothetical protein
MGSARQGRRTGESGIRTVIVMARVVVFVRWVPVCVANSGSELTHSLTLTTDLPAGREVDLRIRASTPPRSGE